LLAAVIVLLLHHLFVALLKPRLQEGPPDLVLAAGLLPELVIVVKLHHLAQGQSDQMAEVLVFALKHRLVEEQLDQMAEVLVQLVLESFYYSHFDYRSGTN
jgi:hypothetical protein